MNQNLQPNDDASNKSRAKIITSQTLTLTIYPAVGDEGFEIRIATKSNDTTELTTKGGTLVVRTAVLIALGRKLEAIYPHAVNEKVE